MKVFYLGSLMHVIQLVGDFDSTDLAYEAQSTYCPPVFDEDFV